jgi:hypothetical protein
VIVITVAYCSNLTAFLTVAKIPPAFETVKGLHDTGLSVTSLGDFFKDGLASAVDPYLKVGMNLTPTLPLSSIRQIE